MYAKAGDFLALASSTVVGSWLGVDTKPKPLAGFQPFGYTTALGLARPNPHPNPNPHPHPHPKLRRLLCSG